jgi:hypothetical protein
MGRAGQCFSTNIEEPTMNRHSIARILCIAGMAVTPLVFANGGIVKCIGPGGHVTLTDTVCPSNERSEILVAGSAEAADPAEPAAASLAAAPAGVATAARTAAMVRTRLPAHSAARIPLARLDPPSRSLGRDVLTLKAARQAMMLMDSAADSMRGRRVAGLR